MRPKEYYELFTIPEDGRYIFTLMPIEFELQYKKFIKEPIESIELESGGVTCGSYHDMEMGTDMVDEVWKNIQKAGIVIANITGFNPKVMLELGVALMKKNRVIIIAEKSLDGKANLPINISALEVDFYEPKKMLEYSDWLKKRITNWITSEGPTIKDADVKSLMKDALQLRREKKFDTAYLLFENMEKRDPANWYIYKEWGITHREDKNYEEARKKLEQALYFAKTTRYKSEIYTELGVVFSENKMMDNALVAFEKAENLNQESADLYDKWAYSLYTTGKYSEAMDKMKEALRLDSSNELYRWKFEFYSKKFLNPNFSLNLNTWIQRKSETSGTVSEPVIDGDTYPPISIKSLTLHNIKCFQHIMLSFQGKQRARPWTLLIGDNGVGKTTILNCIALCALGPELASKIVHKPEDFLRIGASEGYMEAVFDQPVYPIPGLTYQVDEEDIKEDIVIRLSITKGKRIFELEVDKNSNDGNRIRELFIDLRQRTDFDGWFVAGYGAVRNLLFTDEPWKITSQDPVTDRVQSLFDPTKLLIDPNSLYRFLSGDTTPFREMGAPAKLNLHTTRYIRDLLDRLLPFISLTLKSPNDSGKLETPFGMVPISELSEGYKSMLSWLSHLIVHLLAADNWRGDVNRIIGIVLIDEVDLHLHPGWQQNVIPLLQEAFPNLQFIGSTHSPMTAGGAKDGDMILLERNEGNITVKQDLPSIKGWRADQILTGPLFGLESTISRDKQQEMAEYEKLLGIAQPSAEEKKRLKELEDRLNVTIPSTGETELQREAFRLIEETMVAHFKKKTAEEKARLQKEIKRQLKEL